MMLALSAYATDAASFNAEVITADRGQLIDQVTDISTLARHAKNAAQARSFHARNVAPFLETFRGQDGRVTKENIQSVLEGLSFEQKNIIRARAHFLRQELANMSHRVGVHFEKSIRELLVVTTT